MGVREKVGAFDCQSGNRQGILIHVVSMNPAYRKTANFEMTGPFHTKRALVAFSKPLRGKISKLNQKFSSLFGQLHLQEFIFCLK